MKKILQNKKLFGIGLIGFLLITVSTGYLIYSLTLLKGIENFLRKVGIGCLILIWIAISFGLYKLLSKKTKKKQKNIGFFILVIFTILYSIALYFGASNIDRVIGKIGNVTAVSTTYSSSIVTLVDNKAESLEDIGNKKIGMLNDTTSVDGNEIPKAIIEKNKLKNEIVDYDNYVSMIQDLYNGKIEYCFLPTNYSIMFANIDGLENLKEKTKIIYTQTKDIKNQTVNKNQTLNKPFTILIMGVDSDLETIKGSSFNGDSLILITFNPTTLNATMLSIPRDSYVPIACFTGQRKNKITHAAWYGEQCMMSTIENFTGIDIDYFVKINFKGVVKLVDALGGVEADVEYSFCEQNSSRAFGENTVYVKKGYQTLNGEQALAYARNRHPNPKYCSSEWTNYFSNDFVRGQHQQDVIRAIMNKMKSVRDLDTFYSLLDAISVSMETNMSTSEILSLYNVAKDVVSKSKDEKVDELFGIQRLYLSGYDAYIYDYDPTTGQGTRMSLYNFVPYQGSIEDISNAMKINLGLKEAEIQKTFSFDVENEYKETVIGEKTYEEERIPLLADLTGESKSYVESYAKEKGISLTINEVTSSGTIGTISEQSVPSGTDLTYVKKLTVSVIKDNPKEEKKDDKINCSLEENKEAKSCAMPTFIGESLSFVKNWFKKQGYDITVTYTEKKATESGWSESVAGTVASQSTTNAYLYDYINTGKEFEITYWEEAKESTDNPEEENSLEN